MEPNQNLEEQISALVDGECVAQELDHVISALSQPEHQQRWAIYHRIGDLIRDQEPDQEAPVFVLLTGLAVLIPQRVEVKKGSKDFKYDEIV